MESHSDTFARWPEDNAGHASAETIIGLLTTKDMVNIAEPSMALLEAAEDYEDLVRHPSNMSVALRKDCTSALLAGEDLNTVLPHNVHSVTKHILETCLGQELRWGLFPRDFDVELAGERRRLMVMLARGMSITEDATFRRTIKSLNPPQRQLVLRALSGEPLSRTARVLREDVDAISRQKDHITRHLRRSSSTYSYRELKELVQPIWPQPRGSVFTGLEDSLSAFDRECELLGRRLSLTDCQRLAVSFSHAGLEANGVALVLARLNTPTDKRGTHLDATIRALFPDEAARKKEAGRYKAVCGNYLEAFGIRSDARRPQKRGVYEFESEAQQLIYRVLGNVALDNKKGNSQESVSPLLTADEEVLAAQLIERGMWAEMRLALDNPEQRQAVISNMRLYDQAREHSFKAVASHVLKHFAAQGREAFETMLYANVGLAFRFSGHQLSGHLAWDGKESTQLLGGMQGIVRAIRKFDYTSGNKFSTYATPWIRACSDMAVRISNRENGGVSVHSARDSSRIKYAQQRLLQELYRMPTRQEIASATNMSLARVERLLALPATLEVLDLGKEGKDAPFRETGYIARSAQVSLENVRQDFAPETLALFQELFAGQSHYLEIIILHFQERLELPDIATYLDLPQSTVSEYLKESISKLASHRTAVGMTSES